MLAGLWPIILSNSKPSRRCQNKYLHSSNHNIGFGQTNGDLGNWWKTCSFIDSWTVCEFKNNSFITHTLTEHHTLGWSVTGAVSKLTASLHNVLYDKIKGFPPNLSVFFFFYLLLSMMRQAHLLMVDINGCRELQQLTREADRQALKKRGPLLDCHDNVVWSFFALVQNTPITLLRYLQNPSLRHAETWHQ